MSDFKVTGAEDFLRLSKALKAAGQTGLRKELNKALKSAATPLKSKTQSAARSRLPKRGGLSDIVAREPQTVQVRTGAQTGGVRIVVGKRRGAARATDIGSVRHPVFGRDVYVTQSVPPGWFSDTAQKNAPAIRNDLAQALEDFAGRIVREVG